MRIVLGLLIIMLATPVYANTCVVSVSRNVTAQEIVDISNGLGYQDKILDLSDPSNPILIDNPQSRVAYVKSYYRKDIRKVEKRERIRREKAEAAQNVDESESDL